MVQEAYVKGISTRKVDDLVTGDGDERDLQEPDIDQRVGRFLERPLRGQWPYLWLDATYL